MMLGSKGILTPMIPGLLRAMRSRNPQSICNPLIFLRKMATYSCFGGPQGQNSSCKQACVGVLDLLTLVSFYSPITSISAAAYTASDSRPVSDSYIRIIPLCNPHPLRHRRSLPRCSEKHRLLHRRPCSGRLRLLHRPADSVPHTSLQRASGHSPSSSPVLP